MKNLLASPNIFPQEGNGGCTPNPKKLRDDSRRIPRERHKEV